MVYPVARSNRVDGRDRGQRNCGGRTLRIGGTRRSWLKKCQGTGNKIGKKIEVYKILQSNEETTYLKILILLLWGIGKIRASEHHQPFRWSLVQVENSKIISQIVTPGSPSFKVSLGDLIPMQSTTLQKGQENTWKEQVKYYAFYLCPASNPGKGYCNSPGHYYCAYWGCETIASDWEPGINDKFLKIKWTSESGSGCKDPVHRYDGAVTYESKAGWCTKIWMNVSQPNDNSWTVGKTWGIRFWETGTDRGGLIQIRKEMPRQNPHAIGPNSVLKDVVEPSPNTTSVNNGTRLNDSVSVSNE